MDDLNDLNHAIESELQNVSFNVLKENTKQLQAKYRSPTPNAISLMQSKEEKLAYIGYRMKATAGAIYHLMKGFEKEIPGFQVESLLDLGAGPGTSLWALPHLKKLTLIEKDKELIEMGKKLYSHSQNEKFSEINWVQGDFTNPSHYIKADMLLFSYSFGELNEERYISTLQASFDHADKYILILEPGTPAGYQRIMKARQYLIGLGMTTMAPCPHDSPCPMIAPDWCHFSTRISRSSIQRILKEGSMSYEDEKFSYILMSKTNLKRQVFRVLAEPEVLKEKITLKLCTPGGIEYRSILKRDKNSFKTVKKLKNGDNFIIENN